MGNAMFRVLVSVFRQLAGTTKSLRNRRGRRSMRLCETLSLGDRRILALVMVENEKLLVGTAGSSISLLARFPSPEARPYEPCGPEEAERQDPLFGAEAGGAFDAEEYKTWR
ncbi:MAG: flagellar biosynthetic protein FliO [Terriglobia bacterium]